MTDRDPAATEAAPPRRLSREARHRQLLEIAHRIVAEGRIERLSLGYLAERAGVSKPVAYDHFGTRTGLLLTLYRAIDTKRIAAFRAAMLRDRPDGVETAQRLADAYIDCASDTTDEFHAVGAALAGNEERASIFQELIGHSVDLFIDTLGPHCAMPRADLERHCVALVGAGEALAAAVAGGQFGRDAASATLRRLIESSLRSET